MIKKQTIIFFLVVAVLITMFVVTEIVSESLGYPGFFERFNELVLKK